MIANLRNLTKEKREVPMKRHLRNFVASFALLLMAAALVTPALGQATEGFENGIPASWTVSSPPLTGLAGTADSTSGLSPTEGLHYGWISTGCLPNTTCPTVATTLAGYGSLYQGPGTNGLPTGQGLGLPTVETTLTSPSFVFSNSGTISFDVNFITTDGTYDFADYAVVTLIPSGDASPVTLFVANTTCDICAAVPPVGLTGGAATLAPTTASFTGATVSFGSTTYGGALKYGGGLGGPSAWIHVSYPVSAGSYQLQFLVAHVGDTSYPSALAIDNVQTPSLTLPVSTDQITVFQFQHDIYNYEAKLNGGNTTNVTVTPILMSQAACNLLVNPLVNSNFPGAQCFVYQDANGPGSDSTVMFEVTCPELTDGKCEPFDAELGTNFNLSANNPGFNPTNPFPGWLKGHGLDSAHPCTPNPDGVTPLFASNQIDSFSLTRAGDPHTTGGSGGTGSCWVAPYNTPYEAPSVNIVAPASGVTYQQGASVPANFSCSAVNNSSKATGPYLTVQSCTGTVPSGQPFDTSTLGPHTFTASVTDSATDNASQTVNYTVVGPANLAILKLAAPKVATGSKLTYAIGVADFGPANAVGVVVTDTLPSGTIFVSASGNKENCGITNGHFGCSSTPVTCSGNSTVTCNIGTLMPLSWTSLNGATIQITVTVTATGGTIKNTATVSGSNADPNPGNNSSTASTLVTAHSRN
jgi:uncharacterized repeat protein (TIGR01451 family)